jgi:NAD(P)-dependent dehydrogenase (short-subunit alcohol dehydrogenase family)
MSKTVVVTGGNSGIGLATAHELASEGATVVLACRNQGKAAAARDEILSATPGADVDVMSVDLSSFEHIRRFAADLVEKHPKVDVLVNNAGAVPQKQQFTEEGFELQFGANYLGAFLLTHLVLPQLEAAAAETGDARIIHLSSIVHNIGRIDPSSFRGRKPYISFNAYSQSKLANLMFSNALARRLPDGVSTYALHPGGVDSEIWRELPSLVYRVIKLGLISPEKAAKLITGLSLSQEYVGKSGSFHTAQPPTPVSRTARNESKQDDLYNRSVALTGIEGLAVR